MIATMKKDVKGVKQKSILLMQRRPARSAEMDVRSVPQRKLVVNARLMRLPSTKVFALPVLRGRVARSANKRKDVPSAKKDLALKTEIV